MSKSIAITHRINPAVVKASLLSILFIVSYLLLINFSSPAFAQGLQAPGGSLAADTKVEAIPQYIVNLLFLIAAFLAVAYLMYGGIKWITSRGDKTAVEAARKHIVAAVIGLIIVAGAFFILNVVFRLLGADNPLEDGFKLQTINEVNDEIE